MWNAKIVCIEKNGSFGFFKDEIVEVVNGKIKEYAITFDSIKHLNEQMLAKFEEIGKEDLIFEYSRYEDMNGYWVEIKTTNKEYVISGGHFNSKEEVFRFYIKSKRYFGNRLKGRVEIL